MSTLFTLPRQFVVDGSGSPRSGAKLFFYEAGTLTLQDTYSDNALATANTNPVVADAAGVFGPIYLANLNYRVILKDSADVQIWDQDNVNAPLLGLLGTTFETKSGNYTVTTDDKGKYFDSQGTFTFSLPAAATAGNGFVFAVFNSDVGKVTINPDGAELVNGLSTIVLYPGDFVTLTCDATEWAGHGVYTIAGSFTPTYTGFSIDPSGDINYTLRGNVVRMILPAGPGTSNATTFTISNLPAALRPQAGTGGHHPVTTLLDNGNQSWGSVSITTSATMTFYNQGNASGFTASGNKGFISFGGGAFVQYPLLVA